MGPLAGRRIVLGVTGGIAAYKAVEVCRRLVDAGAHVAPVMTEGALHFVGRATFDALGSEPVQTSLWDELHPIPHTRLGQGADLVLVCPATARLLSDYRTGRSDDLLTATLLATRAPVVVAPAMHTEMWEQPSVAENVAVLADRGVTMVGPVDGRLAGGDVGAGRMAEPADIVAAAFEALATGRFPDPVTIRLPRGETPSFALAEHALDADCAEAGIVKDAGDDPDVTHGALVRARVARAAPGTGIRFHAGEGVGTVTRPGLALPVGEPAINPGPRALIRETLQAVAERCGRGADAEVTLSIPGGEALAERTANGRLGILGGLSILGTTGIVMPYSCAAWIHSIHRGIDVARATGIDHVAGATGRTSEETVRKLYDLPEGALLDMGDFAGGMLKYLRRHPVPRLTIAGGFGKLVKLGQGAMDLHSSRSQVDHTALATLAREIGAGAVLARNMAEATSAGAVLALARDHDLALADAVAGRARESALATLAGDIALDVVVIDRAGAIVGRAGA